LSKTTLQNTPETYNYSFRNTFAESHCIFDVLQIELYPVMNPS